MRRFSLVLVLLILSSTILSALTITGEETARSRRRRGSVATDPGSIRAFASPTSTFLELPMNDSTQGVAPVIFLFRIKLDSMGKVQESELDSCSSADTSLAQQARELIKVVKFDPKEAGQHHLFEWLHHSVVFLPKWPGGLLATDSLPDESELILVDEQPEMIFEEPPEYPGSAKAKGVSGTVWIKALVDKRGQVARAKVEHSSGSKDLDRATLGVAHKNKFIPAMKNGKPVPFWITYKVEFKVSDDSDFSWPTRNGNRPNFLHAATCPALNNLFMQAEHQKDFPKELKALDEYDYTSIPATVIHPDTGGPAGEFVGAIAYFKFKTDGLGFPKEVKSVWSTTTDSHLIARARDTVARASFSPYSWEKYHSNQWLYHRVEFEPWIRTQQEPIGSETDERPDDTAFIPVDIQPEMIYEEAPIYPQSAKAAGVSGVVWVKALVGKSGKVHEAKVARSSGTPALDSSAVAAAYHNHFKPAMQDGQPVAIWVTYKVSYKVSE